MIHHGNYHIIFGFKIIISVLYIIRQKNFSYSYNGEEHLYFVDFQVNDEYIELKGPQFFDEMGNFINPYDRTLDALYKQKYNCMINNGIKIIRDCKIYLNYVKQKYGKNFIKEHKRY